MVPHNAVNGERMHSARKCASPVLIKGYGLLWPIRSAFGLRNAHPLTAAEVGEEVSVGAVDRLNQT